MGAEASPAPAAASVRFTVDTWCAARAQASCGAAPARPFDGAGARGIGRVRLVRSEGRGVSYQYGVWDAACPISTG